MSQETVGTSLRQRRMVAGISQRELAHRSGVPQPNISAYESGRRQPTQETLQRFEDALKVPTLTQLRNVREQILQAARARRLDNIRVFGSVVRGAAHAGSDVDLLVHPAEDASLFDLAGFMTEVEELMGVPVDVVSDRGHGPTMDRIRDEAAVL